MSHQREAKVEKASFMLRAMLSMGHSVAGLSSYGTKELIEYNLTNNEGNIADVCSPCIDYLNIFNDGTTAENIKTTFFIIIAVILLIGIIHTLRDVYVKIKIDEKEKEKEKEESHRKRLLDLIPGEEKEKKCIALLDAIPDEEEEEKCIASRSAIIAEWTENKEIIEQEANKAIKKEMDLIDAQNCPMVVGVEEERVQRLLKIMKTDDSVKKPEGILKELDYIFGRFVRLINLIPDSEVEKPGVTEDCKYWVVALIASCEGEVEYGRYEKLSNWMTHFLRKRKSKRSLTMMTFQLYDEWLLGMYKIYRFRPEDNFNDIERLFRCRLSAKYNRKYIAEQGDPYPRFYKAVEKDYPSYIEYWNTSYNEDSNKQPIHEEPFLEEEDPKDLYGNASEQPISEEASDKSRL
eukprot:GHVH01012432.1.p1 GENE.GHVH01012432.1~~GHVH01012432.1.p1  ORF type:complete len:406 (-),score=52.91 GHVH01012432.1:497-1714(-)